MTRFLKNINTGVVFVYNERIAQQPDLIDYEPEEVNVEEEAEAIQEPQPEVEQQEEIFVEHKIKPGDGPMMEDVIHMANERKVTASTLDEFHLTPKDFRGMKGRGHYSPTPLRLAVMEFKRRVLAGE